MRAKIYVWHVASSTSVSLSGDTNVGGDWDCTGLVSKQRVVCTVGLLGGLAVVLPSLYFAYRFFATTQARKVERIIRAFYWGEIVKIALSAFLVVSMLKLWPDIRVLPFFSGFIGAYLGFWLSPLVF